MSNRSRGRLLDSAGRGDILRLPGLGGKREPEAAAAPHQAEQRTFNRRSGGEQFLRGEATICGEGWIADTREVTALRRATFKQADDGPSAEVKLLAVG